MRPPKGHEHLAAKSTLSLELGSRNVKTIAITHLAYFTTSLSPDQEQFSYNENVKCFLPAEIVRRQSTCPHRRPLPR